MSEVNTTKLTATTLEEKTSADSVSTENIIAGIARAWVDYNQATPVINDSYNVASVTDSATGNFTVNFTNNLPNANYAIGGWVKYSTVSTVGSLVGNSTSTKSISACQLFSNNNGTLVDMTSTAIFVSNPT